MDTLEFSFEGGRVVVAGVPRGDAMRTQRQMADSSAAYFLRFCDRLTGGRAKAVELRLPYAFEGDPAGHVERFGCAVSFDHEVAQVVFESADLTLPLATADSALHDALVAHCDAMLREKDGAASPSMRAVQEAIVRLLPRQRARMGPVAQELVMSERTLQRRLADHGTSFSELRDGVRRRLAVKYLTDGDESIAHIAYILDYASQSSFNAAFLRLTGKTPGEVRRGAQAAREGAE